MERMQASLDAADVERAELNSLKDRLCQEVNTLTSESCWEGGRRDMFLGVREKEGEEGLTNAAFAFHRLTSHANARPPTCCSALLPPRRHHCAATHTLPQAPTTRRSSRWSPS